MSEESKNKEALEILLGTLEENPDLWETRKKTAKLMYEDEKYLEAADILWGAPEIPATDVDVAFALQVISRVKPNRSIRLIYEVLRRNQGKPLKNMAVARALNNVGLYMEAARFYGAAIADDTKLFNLAFERQMLWMDDSKRLIEEWKDSNQDAKMPLDVPEQELTGGMIRPSGIHNEIDGIVDGVQNPNPVQVPTQPGTPVPTQPLVVPGARPLPQAQAVPAPPAGKPMLQPTGTNPLLQPGNPLATPNADNAPVRSIFNTGAPAQAAPQGPPAQAAPQGPPAQAAPQGPPAQAAPQGPPAQAAPQGPPPATNPLTGQPVVPGAPQGIGSSTRALMVAGVPQQGQSPTNILNTPGGTPQPTNLLIPGNSGAGGNPVNPPEAVSGQGVPLAAGIYSAPQASNPAMGTQTLTGQAYQQPAQAATTPMMRRPPTMVSSQPAQPAQQVQQMMPGMQMGVYPGMQMYQGMPGTPGMQMPMATQPMMPMGQAMPGMQMPMATQPMMAMGQAMPGMQMPMGQAMPGMQMPMATQQMMPMQGYPGMVAMPIATQPLVTGMTGGVPITPGMMQPVPGMPMATQPLMPGQTPGLPQQQAPQPPPGATPAGFKEGPGSGLRFK